jgi:YfiH family protein
VRYLFYGKPTAGGEAGCSDTLSDDLAPVSWLSQKHSAEVVEARPGHCGPGDALLTRTRGLALRIVTADCVPVLLFSQHTVAAVHAGWRGVRDGIVAGAVQKLGGASEVEAVVGPCIGGCCYEVGDEVARMVCAASTTAGVLIERPGDRPHLDLARAVSTQLEACGVASSRRIAVCTRCHTDLLWSYRREGPGAGRNHAFVWLDVELS